MLRDIFKWITVVSLIGVGITSSIFFLGMSGWGDWAAKGLGAQMFDMSLNARMGLAPLAAFSAAIYILLLDRDLRGSRMRGFDVC